MSSAPRITELLNRLHTPTQDLVQLSFCKTNPAAIKAWVDALPLTQMNFVSTQLYRALPEIARLKTTPETRLAMLEHLRSPTQQTIQGLSQSFLNQPLILPEAARKTATIAQALQKHMSNGYLAVVRELCQTQTTSNPEGRKTQALAIARAITGLGLLLVRSYQLYTPISGQLWIELHSLYALAEVLDLLDSQIQDPLPYHMGIKTPEQAYLRLLLLACARPNQLRQDEVVASYRALESLSALGKLSHYSPERKDNLYAVILDSDQPPLYKSRLNLANKTQVRELNTSQVAARLQEVSKSETTTDLPNGVLLSPALSDHLIHAWNLLAQRSFDRHASNGHLNITVGLTNIHYYISGKLPFPLFLNRTSDYLGAGDKGGIFRKLAVPLKETQEAEDDPWGEAFDVGGGKLAGAQLPTLNIESNIRQQEQQNYQGKHPVYRVPLVDISPGGYCLEWQEEIPGQVKVGELLGMHEDGRHKWSIGVVRWVQQTQGSTQLGIQILAPQAVPLGIAMIHKEGGFSDYLRALQLPALKAVNQPASLITNAVSFREYKKVKLFYARDPQGGAEAREINAQLNRRLFATGAFSQFSFREILAPGTSNAKQADDFDSVWDS